MQRCRSGSEGAAARGIRKNALTEVDRDAGSRAIGEGEPTDPGISTPPTIGDPVGMTSPTEHDGRPRRVVLLVDDDPGDQELTRRAMDRHVGHAELRTVADGEQALDYLERRGAYADRARSPQPDLVLLDLNMPRIDGWQVLERMRSDTSLRAIPVIVLTTSSRPEDIARCYHLGCNSFITKPARLTELDEYLQRIRDFWFETASVPPHD